MENPVQLPNIRIITVSGRIASGATTLAHKLFHVLHWRFLEGGALFEKIHKELGISQTNALKRPDHFDLEYDKRVKKILREEKYNIVQSHLAGFDAQGMDKVFKILVVCEDEYGNDKTDIRIDRLVNRDKVSIEEAKYEIFERERQETEKFKKLYANNDKDWVYWDRKYYDLILNTYSHNKEETFKIALKEIGYK